jgi:ATP-dependent helicase/nuclease subunit B
VYHGLSLQLLTYLLVLQNSGEQLGRKTLTPVAAFYSKLLRSLDSVEHPDDAAAPDEPKFHLRAKPRGIFNGDYIADLDSQLQSGASDVIAAHIKQDDEWGRRNASDVATPQEFSAVLRFVERKIASLADQIIDGDVSIRPYRINGQHSPCSQCDYRAVCRFDVTINRYNPIKGKKRGEVLDDILREVADAH